MHNTIDMSTEIWKDVPEYNGILRASNYGNIQIRIDNEFRTLQPFRNADNYLQVILPCSFENLPKYPYVARIVAATFCKNDDPVKKKIVDHIDNNHLNNRADNLEWVSQAENIKRARNLGRRPKKTKCRCIETDKKFRSIAEAARYYNIRYYSVYGSCETGSTTHNLHFERIHE